MCGGGGGGGPSSNWPLLAGVRPRYSSNFEGGGAPPPERYLLNEPEEFPEKEGAGVGCQNMATASGRWWD